MKWRKKVKEWLTGKSRTGNSLQNVDEAVLAPLILRAALTCKNRPLLAVLPVLTQADRVNAEIAAWLTEFELPLKILYLPETHRGNAFDPAGEARRAEVLHELLADQVDLIIGSALAFGTAVSRPERIRECELRLTAGLQIPFEALLAKLAELDYDDEFEVNVEGEFSRRGGIIDIFSPHCAYPARIEFWGDQIESIRSFNPETQRSTGTLDEYLIISRNSLGAEGDEFDFYDFTRPLNGSLLTVFYEQCSEHLQKYAGEAGKKRFETQVASFRPGRLIRFLDAAEDAGTENVAVAECFPAAAQLKSALPPETLTGDLEMLREMIVRQLLQWLDTGYEISLLGPDKSAPRHIRRWCDEFKLDFNKITLDTGNLPGGLVLPRQKLVFLTEGELFTADIFRKKSSLPAAKEVKTRPEAEEAAASADLDEGDYAVHLVHGIGRFTGIREITLRGVTREVMVLEYRDGANLYVPLCQAGLVSRYIGSQAEVTVDKLGGRRWLNVKVGAARAIRDFAADLLHFQALRDASGGIAFGPDTLEQRIFEAAFPFEPTVDQARAIDEAKADMAKNRPMDRLLCGDVGYGKTEVALRTAFKAVSAGYQVMFLAPTTILVQQHYYSLLERFAEYPYTVEMLSRFRSKAEQTRIVARLKSGGIDIVIGTHRLFQDDVSFKKLGLVIVDEEQRFGVRHKEKIKRFRAAVDVLTMSATPIPRTLYMAMAGARDLSTIMTAPGARLPIQTSIAPYSEKFICECITNEVKRGGQVFFIHNRVKTIAGVLEKFAQLLPDVRFAIGHGQMPEADLEAVMARFLKGEIDVLICTTIIESGLDIANANTIIIERADRFGLAELYQLRGRIGRWNRQAYAYLLLPAHNVISTDARKRLSAIRRYTHLGAGFRLALRDLEIRGAGNLLGAEQSGHINAVGFDLYCQLLRAEIAKLNGREIDFLPEVEISLDFIHFAHEAPPDSLAAAFPPEYISSERLRIDAYRRLAALTSESQLEEFREELEDRYGNLPAPAEHMLDVTLVKILAARQGYTAVQTEAGKVYFRTSRKIYRRNGILPTINSRNSPPERLKNLLDLARMLRPITEIDQ
ncbi:MAG: transcription-repair coupling factor [Victivallaceae bacterium]|nr:transcription-repair coupling factor [Victivallaceae bacterium]